MNHQLKLCEYCQGDRRVISDEENVELIINKETPVKYYDDGYGWQHEYLLLKYCPMCGLKLEDGAE